MSISVVMITLNEEVNIEACLDRVTWADEIVIMDGGSRDRTISKARKYTDKVYQQPFRDFASQKNAVIAQASRDWIFLLDADEHVIPELQQEIQQIAKGIRTDAVYSVGRETYFFGKRLRFSGTREDYPIRLFPRGRAYLEQPVHEKIVTDLPVRRLKNRLIHWSTRDFSHYRQKLNCYVPLEIDAMRERGKQPTALDILVRPIGRFASLYFWKLGILDGWPGLQFAFLSASYTFLKYRRFSQTRNPQNPAISASSSQ